MNRLISLHSPWPAACAIALAVLGLSACDDLSGVYRDAKGNAISFEGDRAYITLHPAPTLEARAQVHGNCITIQSSGDAITFTRVGSTLEADRLGLTLLRQ